VIWASSSPDVSLSASGESEQGMTTESNTPDVASSEWLEKYKRQRPLYEQFAQEIKRLLTGLLTDEGISYHVIESRAKEPESLLDKAFRPGKSYSNPLDEITDLAGVRVILYYQSDVDRAAAIIQREFNVNKAHSVDKKETLSPDQFGYLSQHYVVTLKSPRKELSEYTKFASLKAEIQIRTILQHTWATVSHKLQYKREADVPAELRRKLFRLASLFELADEQFDELLVQQADHRSAAKEQVAAGSLAIEINVDSLMEYLSHSPSVSLILNEAKKAGLEVDESMSGELVPSTLAVLCSKLNILTIAELDQWLISLGDWRLKYLSQFRQASGGGTTSRAFPVLALLIGAHYQEISKQDLEQQGYRDHTIGPLFRAAAQVPIEGP
jgi:putative GTP pyrophosphokinase